MDVTSARVAFDAGKTRYFTGHPCKRGHVAERMVSNGCCTACMAEACKRHRQKHPRDRTEEARIYRAKHPDKVKAAQGRYQAKNADKIREQAKLAARAIRKRYPEREKVRQARMRERREEKLAALAGRHRPASCDLCNSTERIAFDHCHVTGKFRGWLCDACNRTLGVVKDNPELVRKMADYLENGGTNDLSVAA